MSDGARRAIAWTLLLVSLACGAGSLVIVAVTGGSWSNDASHALLCLTFGGAGLLVVRAAVSNRVGWLLLAVAAAAGVDAVTGALLAWDSSRSEAFTGAALNAEISSVVGWLALGVLIPRLLLVFPTGTLLSPRWRPVAWAQVVVLVTLPLNVLMPGKVPDLPKEYENPLGISSLSALGPVVDVVNVVVGVLFVGGALGAVVGLIVRARRSAGIERLQMKWVAWSVGTIGALFLANALLAGFLDAGLFDRVLALSLSLFPLTVGVAILRYRLYEIDRVISKTLVYGALTVLLGAAYAGLVLTGQAVFSSVAGGSSLAIAVSTLVVAALFLPVRSRVQAFVDRRFYRRRYDAQLTLEAFGRHLREHTELDVLTQELVTLVGETMQPAHVSLSLRGGAAE
jgi:hypothetical protein